MRIKGYLSITKPGIVFGNLISTAAGFFLAAKSETADVYLLLNTLLGVAFVVGSGCVINNIYDRDIDKKMSRTKNRALVTGEISLDHAFGYALVLLLAGTFLLYYTTNPLASVVVLLGYIFYVFFYTMWYKRKSVLGTLVGSLSGAVPPFVGYIAVTNYVSLESVLLFTLFCIWQMPHSYAIAMFRMKDYQQAGIPVLPVVEGIYKARTHMISYVILFNLIALGLFIFGHTGYEYLVVSAAVCFMWTRVTFKTINEENYVSWSKAVFKTSLVVVMGFSTVLGVELMSLSV